MRQFSILATVVAIFGVAPLASASPTAAPSVDATLATVQAARKVMMNDPAAALAIGIDLERRALAAPDAQARRIILSKAKWITGEASLRLNRIEEARRLIDASYALAVAAGDAQSQGNSLLSRGSIRSETGDPAGALQDYLEAYRLFLGTGDARSRSITLQDLSQLYADARDHKRAASYLRQAVEAYGDEPMLQLSLANSMAGLLVEQGQYAAGEKEYRRGLLIARRAGAHSLELKLLNNLAIGQIKGGRLPDAARTIAEAVRIANRAGAPIGDELQSTMARLAFAQGKIMLARQIMDKVHIASDGRRAALDPDAEYEAYRIYKAAGDTRLALAHLEVAGRLHNDALALSISTQASLMSARFDYATQDLRIAALKATVLQRDITVGRQVVARERVIAAAVAVLVLMVIAALAVWLAALRRSRDRFRVINHRLEGANTSLEAALREVGERAQAEHRARQLALHDSLTGLPNRRFLNEEFNDGRGTRGPGDEFVLLLLDLDRFKPINDIHGHEVGDLVLVATAERLSTFCHGIDARVVRLGGDEFVVTKSGAFNDETVEKLAYGLIEAIGLPVYVGERRLTLGASVGVARSPQDGVSIEDLLRAADIAMYEAKRSGRNVYRLFDPAMKGRQRLRAV